MAASPSWSSTDGRPALGVVIVSYNTTALLDRCLTSLRAALESDGLLAESEVWVVDNASPDGSAGHVAGQHPWVRLEALTENVGFTAGNNLILGRYVADPTSCPDYVLVLNPDTELPPGALVQLRDALAMHPEAAVAGPVLRYPDGRFQAPAFRFPGLAQTWLDLWPVSRLMDSPLNGRYPRRSYEAGAPFAVDFILGACMLVRGRALVQVGPLDTGYYMYCEEIDWCRRFRAAGWGSLCVPAAEVMHHGAASSSQLGEEMFVHLWRSRRRYFALHAPWPRRWAIEGLLRASLALRALSDRWATARGRLSPAQRDRRLSAYRQILARMAP